jgi:hypothetical protein
VWDHHYTWLLVTSKCQLEYANIYNHFFLKLFASIVRYYFDSWEYIWCICTLVHILNQIDSIVEKTPPTVANSWSFLTLFFGILFMNVAASAEARNLNTFLSELWHCRAPWTFTVTHNTIFSLSVFYASKHIVISCLNKVYFCFDVFKLYLNLTLFGLYMNASWQILCKFLKNEGQLLMGIFVFDNHCYTVNSGHLNLQFEKTGANLWSEIFQVKS